MAKKLPILEQMRANPQKDWDIDDVAKLCAEHDITLEPPSNGSHYKVVSEHLAGHQTVPAKRPIKPVYIKCLVRMIDAHNAAAERKG